MTSNTTAVDPDVTKIENSLHSLLTYAIRADFDPDARLIASRGPVSASVLSFEAVTRMSDWTQAQRDAEELFANPVSTALRTAVRVLGKRLYEIGGMKLMSDVLDRVADRDPEMSGRRECIMDHRWDGIGRSSKSAGWTA